MTGLGRGLKDNPKLTVRIDGVMVERPPVRIVLDSQLKIPMDCNLIGCDKAQTLVMTTNETAERELQKINTLAEAGVEVVAVNGKGRHCDLVQVLEILGQRGIQQLLIEAGPALQTAFLWQGLADEARIYIAPLILGVDGDADISALMTEACKAVRFKHTRIDVFDGDVCIRGLF